MVNKYVKKSDPGCKCHTAQEMAREMAENIFDKKVTEPQQNLSSNGLGFAPHCPFIASGRRNGYSVCRRG